MAHDRDAVLNDVVDGVGDGLTTLELDDLSTAFLEKSCAFVRASFFPAGSS